MPLRSIRLQVMGTVHEDVAPVAGAPGELSEATLADGRRLSGGHLPTIVIGGLTNVNMQLIISIFWESPLNLVDYPPVPVWVELPC